MQNFFDSNESGFTVFLSFLSGQEDTTLNSTPTPRKNKNNHNKIITFDPWRLSRDPESEAKDIRENLHLKDVTHSFVDPGKW